MKRILSILFCVMAVLSAAAQDSLYINDFTIEAGETRVVEIQLDNSVAYTALQADIYLPDGLAIEQEDGDYLFDLTDRKARNHTISSTLLQSGAVRILIASQTLKTFSGNNGALVTFSITADESFTGQKIIELRNIIATDLDRTEYLLPDAACTVTVTPIMVTDVTITPASISLPVGSTVALTASVLPENAHNKALTWASTSNSVALVDQNGVVTARGVGTATITATAKDGSGVKGRCTVTVTPILATAISVTPATATLTVGDTTTLQVVVTPDETTNPSVTWTSSDTGVATVSDTGVVTAVAAGTASITATTADGSNLSASCDVTVNAPQPEGVALNTHLAQLQLRQTMQLVNTTGAAVTWTSSDPTMALVDANGIVAALRHGMVAITATDADGNTDSCAVFCTLSGDINEDGMVDIDDINAIINIILGQ